MKCKVSFILFFLFVSTAVVAQDKKAKSAQSKKSQSIKMDDENFYYDKAEELKEEPLKATKLIEKGLSISLDNNDEQGEINAYLSLGKIFKYNKQYDLAIQNYVLAEKKMKKGKKVLSSVDIEMYDNLAFCYEKIENYKEALVIRQKLELTAKQNQNEDQLKRAMEDVGFDLWKIRQFQEAIQQYQKVLNDYASSLTKDQKIGIYNRMGDIYVDWNKSNLAKTYYNKALNLSNTSEDSKLRGQTTEKLSKVYRKEKDYESEIQLRSSQLSSPAPQKENNLQDINSNKLKLGEIYLEQNKADEAIPLLESSVELSRTLGDRENKKEALKYLSEAYAKSAQYDKALKFYKKYTALHDSLLREKERIINESSKSYKDLSQQNNQISLLKKDMDFNKQVIANLQKEKLLNEANMKRQQFFIYALVFVMAVMVLLIYFILKSSKQKRIANQLLALKSLRSQMNPHFIFNSLNSVNHFIMQNDERAANKYLSDFSKLMRSVMENSQEDFVSLNKEIEILTLYLKLEHQRFSDKFDYEFHIDPAIETDQFLVPPMLIQPYIENAIWHGLRYKETKGMLKVDLKEEGDFLKIQIEDDGIGRRKSQELKTRNQKQNTSTGMRNTKERVAVMNELFKTNMHVDILDLPNDAGTKIEISIARRVQGN